ncbi:MAG: thioredoxin [bacterium]|nr:thioredoxin [bacterium]
MKLADVTDQTFNQEVLKSKTPVLVDFWAPWCGPCKIIGPFVEELSAEYGGKVKFVKVNVDENPQKAAEYQVFSIPNLKFFKNGVLADEIVGAVPKEIIKKMINSHL